MAQLYADENVPIALVQALRDMGHSVLTAHEANQANQGISDEEVLRYATDRQLAVLTNNRRDFHGLHTRCSAHAGIITFSRDPQTEALANRINQAINSLRNLNGQLIRVTR